MNDAAEPLNEFAKDASNLAKEAGGNEAYGRIEKDITTVKTEIARLSAQIADAVNALGARAQSSTRRGLKGARANVDALASNASERAGAAANAMTVVAQDTASSIGDTLADAIEQRPLASLALAMGIGFLIGVTWRR